MDRNIQEFVGKTVRHFKGGNYLVLGLAKHTETLEVLVIYKALYGSNEVFARPLSMFLSQIDRRKYPNATQKYRLELVELDKKLN